MSVITRFAPSPTGMLHIGGARTALFNYMYTKHMGGKFLLRIEDTDKLRSTKESVDAILDGLTFLEINWDEDYVLQSKNLKKHQDIAYKLVEEGNAYYCYCKPKRELEGEDSEKEHTCNCYEIKEKLPNSSPAVRLKVNKEGSTIVNDLILKRIEVQNKQISDFILLRSDGNPTYLLSCVVDDIDMKITHVIRGDDHLTNTFRQIQIYKALNAGVPQFAHLPLIHGEDGHKMSKRHGAIAVKEYEKMGFLPKAICNYLLRLGWSLGNQEIISKEEAIKNFDIKNVNKSPARFDFTKLAAINSHYIKELTDTQLLNALLPYIENLNQNLSPSYKDRLLKIIPSLKTRFKNLVDMAKATTFILVDSPYKIEDTELLNILNTKKDLLIKELTLLENIDVFNKDNLHTAINSFTEKESLKLNEVMEPLRAAICFSKNSIGSVSDLMEILGKEEVIARIKNVL